MKPKILLITDSLDLANPHAQGLERIGADITVLNHHVAMSELQTTYLDSYALVLIYLFEEKNGNLGICQQLRAAYDNPILLFTSERDEHFLLSMYEAGVSDCIVLPVCFDLLLAKVRAWLRHAGAINGTMGMVEAYGFRFDQDSREVITPQNSVVRLSRLEARLLTVLMSNEGFIIPSEYLIQRVWSDEVRNDTSAERLHTLVHRLRTKLGKQYIQPSRNQGYSFRPNGVFAQEA